MNCKEIYRRLASLEKYIKELWVMYVTINSFSKGLIRDFEKIPIKDREL